MKGEKNQNPVMFRIVTKDGRIKYAGTDRPSWLTLEQARSLVDHSGGEMIYQYSQPGGDRLWEIF